MTSKLLITSSDYLFDHLLSVPIMIIFSNGFELLGSLMSIVYALLLVNFKALCCFSLICFISFNPASPINKNEEFNDVAVNLQAHML